MNPKVKRQQLHPHRNSTHNRLLPNCCVFCSMKYEKHLFICTNQRADVNKKSCGTEHGEALVARFKELITENKLQIDIRAQKTACLDACKQGPSMVVYPEAVWYGNVQLEDVTEIFEQHLVNNQPVERLRVYFPAKS